MEEHKSENARWLERELENSKVVIFTEEDLKAVSVFVGNKLEDIETLKYCKVTEKIEKFERANQDYKKKN